ncbi:LysR family transcriptional regulator [Streptoverticillium reticulum]|uniref:LysR family transcriptional regulator n=1 Tax=Streptoverticillium reticulum TaxID=1433415 RepID=UPI0039BF3BB5
MREPEGVNGAGSLSLRRLAYLVVTVGEGRPTRAAQRLHVTEPTVSQQLKALEGAVGTPLLVRGPDGVRPTPAGEALLPHARTALRSAGQGRAAALAEAGGHEETVRVATLPPLLTGLLPALRAWALAPGRPPRRRRAREPAAAARVRHLGRRRPGRRPPAGAVGRAGMALAHGRTRRRVRRGRSPAR